MSSHSLFYLLNVMIVLTAINCRFTKAENHSKHRNAILQSLDNKRIGIQYVINVLTQMDQNLAKVEENMVVAKRSLRGCSPIGGLPGADCETNEMGEEAKAQKMMRNSLRNPGRKRTNSQVGKYYVS